MDTNLTLGIGLAAALSCSLATAQLAGKKAAPNGKSNTADAQAPLRFPLPERRTERRRYYIAKIDSVTKEGIVQTSPPADIQLPPAGFVSDLTEGYYLAVVQESQNWNTFAGARLFRAVVTNVGDNGRVEFQIAKSVADALKAGEFVTLLRTSGTTTEQLKQLPDVAPIEVGPVPGAKKESDSQLQLAKSAKNLRQIGLAMHNFHQTFGHFPPAVVFGPDKKPWHSWRIILLPYLDALPLYNQYKWDEPWNGPNNKKLLEKMPAVYADPVHGENKEFYTHYSAITGDGMAHSAMAFSAEGAEFDGSKQLDLVKAAGRRAFAEFTDGTSFSLLVGPVGPDRKIPWMKPEDVKVDDKLPELGSKGSFALPHITEKGNGGPFLICDGSVRFILAGIGTDVFRKLLTINEGLPIYWEQVPTITTPLVPDPEPPAFYIIRDGNKTTARLAGQISERLPDAP